MIPMAWKSRTGSKAGNESISTQRGMTPSLAAPAESSNRRKEKISMKLKQS